MSSVEFNGVRHRGCLDCEKLGLKTHHVSSNENEDEEEALSVTDWSQKLKSFVEFNGDVWISKPIPRRAHFFLKRLLVKKFKTKRIFFSTLHSDDSLSFFE